MGEPSGEDDSGQTVGADDVTGEEDAVNEPEQDHPPAPTPHQAAGVDGGLLARPGLLVRHRLTAGPRTGQGGEVGLGSGVYAPLDHGHEPEAEEHREQRVGPMVDEQLPDEHPPGVGRRGLDGVGDVVGHLVPYRNIGHGDEQQHEAASHVGGRVAHAPTGEGGRHLHVAHLIFGAVRALSPGEWSPRVHPCSHKEGRCFEQRP